MPELTGLALLLLPTVGRMERDRLQVMLQMQINKTVSAVARSRRKIASRRRPSAALQLSPDGCLVRLGSSYRLASAAPERRSR